jgi:DNA-binding MarR family transcriptional regulator
VKLVFLTARGAKMMKEMLAEFHQPPAEMLKLSSDELAHLERILKKLKPPAA